MTCICRRYDREVQKIKMAAVLQLKINNYILETRISFLPKKINMGVHENVYDSYVIGYDVIHLHW